MTGVQTCALPILTSYEYGRIRKSPTWYGTNGCLLSKAEEGTEGYFEQRPGHESDIGMLMLTIDVHIRDKTKTKLNLEKIYL